jgi:hypothetical protein
MTGGAGWERLFRNWPKDVPPRGLVVTNYDEQIPFDGFLSAEGMVLLERKTPDNMGARKVLLAYENIVGVKFTDVIKKKAFEDAGFVGRLKE